MNLKIAFLLFLILSASAFTITATTFTSPTPNILISTRALHSLNSKIQPLGDPIDDPVFPK